MCPFRPSPEELEQHAAALRRLARGLVREADADDLAQDTLVAAWRSPSGPRTSTRGWLRGIARNLASKKHREAERRARREASAARAGVSPSTADVLARLDLQRRVLAEVRRLDEPYRSALFLRYFEDEPPRVVARRLEAPVATIHTWLRRGREQLRERLDEAHGGSRKAWMLLLTPWPGMPSTLGLLGGALLMKRALVAVVGLALLGFVAWRMDLLPDLGREGPEAPALRTEAAEQDARSRLLGRAPADDAAEPQEAIDPSSADATHRLRLHLVAEGGLPDGTARVVARPLRHMVPGDRWDGTDVDARFETSDGTLDGDLSLLFDEHRLPMLEVEVRVDHPSCLPARLRFKPAEMEPGEGDGALVYEAEVRLLRAGLLTGRVVFEDGTAVSAAAVGVWPPEAERTRSAVESVRADADGRFRLRVPDGGEWVVIAGLRDCTPVRQVVAVGREENLELPDLVLRGGLSVGGTFLLNGTPVPEAPLTLRRPYLREAWDLRYDLDIEPLSSWTWHERGGWQHGRQLCTWLRPDGFEIRETGAVTAEDGSFRFAGLRAGTWEIHLPAHVSTGFLHRHVTQDVRATVEVPGAPVRVDLTTSALRIRVLSEGHAVESAHVHIGVPGPPGPGGERWGPAVGPLAARFEGSTMPVLVRPDFTYRVEVRSKQHAVVVREVTSPAAGLEETVTIEIGPSAAEDESVKPPQGAVRARVRAIDGSEITRTAFGFYPDDRSHARYRRNADLRDGAFFVEGIPPGRYRLVARAGGTWVGCEGFWQDAEMDVDLVDGETVDVSFVVRAGGRLRLKCHDSRGRPVGAQCRIRDSEGQVVPVLYVSRNGAGGGWGSNLGTPGPHEVDRILPPGRYVVDVETWDKPPREARGEVVLESGKVSTLELRIPDE